jgi:hypothetical protein
MMQQGHVARIVRKMSVYWVLAGQRERGRPVKKTYTQTEYNIKLDLREIG